MGERVGGGFWGRCGGLVGFMNVHTWEEVRWEEDVAVTVAV